MAGPYLNISLDTAPVRNISQLAAAGLYTGQEQHHNSRRRPSHSEIHIEGDATPTATSASSGVIMTSLPMLGNTTTTSGLWLAVWPERLPLMGDDNHGWRSWHNGNGSGHLQHRGGVMRWLLLVSLSAPALHAWIVPHFRRRDRPAAKMTSKVAGSSAKLF